MEGMSWLVYSKCLYIVRLRTLLINFMIWAPWGSRLPVRGDISAGKPARMVDEEMAVLLVTQLLG